MQTTIKTHTVQGEPMHITIRLSDPRKNGHNDFAITADIWNKGAKKLTERTWDRGGCVHDDILKKMPSLQLFVALHLSEESRAPMYAVETGYYHLQGVLGTAAVGHKITLKKFADYMRVSLEEAKDATLYIKDKSDFSIWVDSLRPRWQAEADEAKARLVKMIANLNVPA